MRVKMMSGDILTITEEEAKNVVGKSGLVFVPSLSGMLNLSSVESIMPEEAVDNLKEGFLHDGTRVVKKFGSWVDAANPDVKLDPNYYPEIARDEILPNKVNKNKLLSNDNNKRQLGQ